MSHTWSVSRPNIVVVVLDDTGWADFGCFGSEIETPIIDSLAASGLRYNNFHVTPLCSPTRASLLTGRNHHSIGMRFLADVDAGTPNSRGRVRRDVSTLPAVLRSHGYGTYMIGKWHLAPLHELGPAGPFTDWPLARGFDRFYGFLDGCTDQYTPELYRDNHAVAVPEQQEYHLSVDLADHAIQMITDHLVFRSGEPFFLQFAFGATHAPLQVPTSYSEPYIDVFSKGWDVCRDDRLRRQKDMGLVPESTTLVARDPAVPAWAELSEDQRVLYTHLQAAYAGFLEHSDAQIGRVVSTLEQLGVRDNTIIMVLSDNGATSGGALNGAVDVNGPYGGARESVARQLLKIDDIGTERGPAQYPAGWAMAGNTPFRRYKQFVDLGGVRSPLVVSWPEGVAAGGKVREQFLHAIDIMPTLIEAAGLQSGSVDGQSFAPTLTQDAAEAPRQTQYWEMLGRRAIWHRGWRAVAEHQPGDDFENDIWRLYDTVNDFSESRDVAAANPEVVEELKQLWWSEAERNDVLPLDDRTMAELLALRADQGMVASDTIILVPGQSHIPFASRVTGTERSMQVEAPLTPGQDGIVLSSGNRSGGYAFYVDGDRLGFEHRWLGEIARCEIALPDAFERIGFRLERNADRSARLSLLVDSMVQSEAVIPATSLHLSFWGLDVAANPLALAVGEAGVILAGLPVAYVTMEFLEPAPVDEVAEMIMRGE